MLGEHDWRGFNRSLGCPLMGFGLFQAFHVSLPVFGVVVEQFQHQMSLAGGRQIVQQLAERSEHCCDIGFGRG